MPRKVHNRAGEVYGRLTVIAQVPSLPGRRASRWLCICECGTKMETDARHLRYGTTISCGCYNREKVSQTHAKGPGESGFNRLYSQYQKAARVRNRVFELSPEAFRELVTQPCRLCGAPPSSMSPTPTGRKLYGFCKHSTFYYNGVDRVDNTRGYVAGNCVPMCKRCNFAKHRMSMKEFTAWLTRLVNAHPHLLGLDPAVLEQPEGLSDAAQDSDRADEAS